MISWKPSRKSAPIFFCQIEAKHGAKSARQYPSIRAADAAIAKATTP